MTELTSTTRQTQTRRWICFRAQDLHSNEFPAVAWDGGTAASALEVLRHYVTTEAKQAGDP